jgi:hypothetical protein
MMLHGPWSWDLSGRDPAPSMHAIMALEMPSPAVGYTSYRPGKRNTPPREAVQVKRNIAGGQEQGAQAVT